jgi:hypothetical protein
MVIHLALSLLLFPDMQPQKKQINKMGTPFFMWGNTEPRAAHAHLIDLTLAELHLYWSIIAREMLSSIKNA